MQRLSILTPLLRLSFTTETAAIFKNQYRYLRDVKQTSFTMHATSDKLQILTLDKKGSESSLSILYLYLPSFFKDYEFTSIAGVIRWSFVIDLLPFVQFLTKHLKQDELVLEFSCSSLKIRCTNTALNKDNS